MILIYVYGSGLGHLKRVLDFLNREKRDLKKCTILTNSASAGFWNKDWKVIIKENSFFSAKEEFFLFFEELCIKKQITEVIVDVFPTGFYGELQKCLESFKGKKTLLARILMDNYFVCNPGKPYFDFLFLMEKGVDPDNYSFRKSLNYSEKPKLRIAEGKAEIDYYILIIHSQPLSEVLHLYQMAKMYSEDQNIIIQCNVIIPSEYLNSKICVIEGEITDDNLIKDAALILSAAGFNTVRELLPYRNKWKCIPFPRTFDDQFLRKKLNY